MEHFELVSPYKPTGDQPQAIDKLVAGLRAGYSGQTLLGVTGSGHQRRDRPPAPFRYGGPQ